jgi:transposase
MAFSFRTAGPDARLALRTCAVRAVLEGERKNDVALRFGVTRQTLRNWVARHRRGGPGALADRPKGRTPRRLLEPWQEVRVAGAIRALPPASADPRHRRWTRAAIAAYITRSFGVPFKVWQVDSQLRGWGFGSYEEMRRACDGQPARAAPVRRRVRRPGPGATDEGGRRPGPPAAAGEIANPGAGS